MHGGSGYPLGYQTLRITRILHVKWIGPPVILHSCDARCRGDASPLLVDVYARAEPERRPSPVAPGREPPRLVAASLWAPLATRRS